MIDIEKELAKAWYEGYDTAYRLGDFASGDHLTNWKSAREYAKEAFENLPPDARIKQSLDELEMALAALPEQKHKEAQAALDRLRSTLVPDD